LLRQSRGDEATQQSDGCRFFHKTIAKTRGKRARKVEPLVAPQNSAPSARPRRVRTWTAPPDADSPSPVQAIATSAPTPILTARKGSWTACRERFAAGIAESFRMQLDKQAELIANATRLYQFQCVITGFLEERILHLEATNKHIQEQNERLQATNRTLSSELARTRPTAKPSPGRVSPYICPWIPKKK
jgi:hypothetical protein